jgi:hypothetical protein
MLIDKLQKKFLYQLPPAIPPHHTHLEPFKPTMFFYIIHSQAIR